MIKFFKIEKSGHSDEKSGHSSGGCLCRLPEEYDEKDVDAYTEFI